MKGLDVFPDTNAHTITLKHSSTKYQNITLFLEEPNYSVVLQYINNYARDNFFKKYLIVEKIGRGHYSEIHKVLSYNKGETFAMKVIMKEGLSQQELEVLHNEARIMEVLRHDNIIKFIEVAENNEYYQYIMEYFDGEDLYNFISKHDVLGEELISKIVGLLAETLIYIHKSGIIHRDLKPENIMIKFNQNSQQIEQVKIIDFGLSCYYTELQKTQEEVTRCGTLNYSAPEVVDTSQNYDERCDIYSLGVIMYYMLYRLLPYAHENSQILKSQILKGELQMDNLAR